MKMSLKQYLRPWIRSIRKKYFHHRVHGLYKGTAAPVGRALLSYLSSAFLVDPGSPAFRAHSNQRRSHAIVHALNTLGYVVDVIDYDDARYETHCIYDLIIGIETAFDHPRRYLAAARHKTYLATGLHWMTQNALSYQRALDLQQRRGYSLAPERMVTPYYAAEKCHSIISVQNEFTNATYRHLKKPLYFVRSSVPVFAEGAPLPRKTEQARGCLWISGGGYILKGLDLVLEAAAQTPECSLRVCAYLDSDPAFKATYSKELFETPNIKVMGWQDLGSAAFQEMAATCVMTVYPYPEAEISSSLLNSLYLGLFPILSQFNEDGVLGRCAFKTEPTVCGLAKALQCASMLPGAEVQRRSALAREIAEKIYSPAAEQAEWVAVMQQLLENFKLPRRSPGAGRC